MKECAHILKNADKIALLPHIKPDGDTLGSAFALCAALRRLGKTCYVVTDYDITGKLAVLLEGNDYHTKNYGGFDMAVAIDVADRNNCLFITLADSFIGNSSLRAITFSANCFVRSRNFSLNS